MCIRDIKKKKVLSLWCEYREKKKKIDMKHDTYYEMEGWVEVKDKSYIYILTLMKLLF